MNIINIGKENANFQELYALKQNRTKRTETGMFFVEGVQNIKDAISNKWEIYAFIYAQTTDLSSWAKSILNNAEKCFVLTEQLMKKFSDKTDVSEILAVIKKKSFNDIVKTKNPIYILLDRPSKKGNLGTIIRSCDALGVDQIFYSGHAVDIYDPNVITASMGSFFKLPITFIDSNKMFVDLIDNLKQSYADFQVVATSLQANQSVQCADFKKPTMLLIGNEADGLCKFYNQHIDNAVKIDMRPNIDSLNIACATSICLYEIQRQRNNGEI